MVLAAKDFDTPDEIRRFGHGQMRVVSVGGSSVGLARFEPGWRWSVDVQPLAGTESCQAHHTGFIRSGRMRIRMDDGTEAEAGPGAVVVISAGHDGWVVGDEPCEMLDWTAAARYAAG